MSPLVFAVVVALDVGGRKSMSTPGNLHRWGNPDVRGIRACNNAGCTVRVRDSFRQWQKCPDAPWKSWLRYVDEGCTGGEPSIKEVAS